MAAASVAWRVRMRRVDGLEGARVDASRYGAHALAANAVAQFNAGQRSPHRRRGGGDAGAPRAARAASCATDPIEGNVRGAAARRRARSFREVHRPTWSSSGPCSVCSLSCLCARVAALFLDVSGRRERESALGRVRERGTRAPRGSSRRPPSGGSSRTRSTDLCSSATWRTPRAPTRPCRRPSTASCPSRPTRSPPFSCVK